jgi:alpha-tubulin suppressor-like RCC1 family protein
MTTPYSKRKLSSCKIWLALTAICVIVPPALASGPLVASQAHGLMLAGNNTVCGVGENTHGELGDGTDIDRLTAVTAAAIASATGVSTGYMHSLAVQSNGTVWSWGFNDDGELGNGTTNPGPTPMPVSGLTGMTAVAAGQFHSLALKNDGTVWAWGYNGNGRLGDGTGTTRTRPVQVINLTGVVAIAAGASSSMALKNDGTVWTWGDNSSGQLGIGTFTQSLTPVQVAGLTNVMSIAAGEAYNMALKNDGTVWSWGAGGFGQLGNGSTAFQPNIVQASALTGVIGISAGVSHSLAVKSDGTVWAFGRNDSGQLGDGTISGRLTPVQVTGLTGEVAVAAGAAYSQALKSDGTIKAWGNNAHGQLGNGTTTASIVPVSSSTCASGVFATPGTSPLLSRLAASQNHSLVLKSDGTVWAWGENADGELGDGTIINRSSPVQAAGVTGALGISAGYMHSLAVLTNGTVLSWGFNADGELGSGTTNQRSTPLAVTNLTGVTAVAAGQFHSLALKNDGTVSAWGYNGNGRLGDGTGTTRLIPVQVINLTGVTAIAAGGNSSMALKSDGTVWTWGDNSSGQLGIGTFTQSLTPVQVAGLTGVVAIAAGDAYCMALKSDGTVWTWGYGGFGQLGNGSTAYQPDIVRASSLTGVIAIAAGVNHSLAVKNDGTVWSWGANGSGQLGDGSVTNRTTPVQVSVLTNGVAVAAGSAHSLAVQRDNSIWAWGSNSKGQFGVATPASSTVPISTLPGFVVLTGPVVAIETPSQSSVISGTTTVSGWAVDPFYSGIGGVVVKVDGNTVGNATYGVSRPDVCVVYPGRPNCPNVGFTFALNTSGLSAGAHTISVTATDTDGTPDSASASIGVTVPSSLPTISGQVTAAGVGLSGVTISVNGSQTTSTTTDASGNYSLSLPANGTYTLAPAKSGFSFSSPVTFSNLTTNQVANFSGIAVAGLVFYPVTPCRIADTRTAAGFSGAYGPPLMAAQSTRTFNIPASACGIPSTAAAYSLNFTVIPLGPLGNLTTWPTGLPMPNVSTLNDSLGTIVANAAIVPAGANGSINIFVTDATNVLFDINGYFAPQIPSGAGLSFYSATPCRIADTRTAAGFPAPYGPPSLAAQSTRTFNIPASPCGIPSTAAAYSLNFTAIPPGPLGNLTTWPTGQPIPNVSTLNDSLGTIVANAAIVPAGANGAINTFVTDATNLLFDINGYFAPPLATGLKFYPVTPCRIADTRAAAGFSGAYGPPALAAQSTRTFNIPASSCEIPSTAAAYSLNFTVIPLGPLGNLTTWPTGQAIPNVSTLNDSLGTIVANAAIVPAGANGAINIFVTDATNVLFDINGYFAP